MIDFVHSRQTNLKRQHLRKTAGRWDGHTLAAALEEWLEALGILQKTQGRSQAAPLAASRQRTRCRDRTRPQRPSRILRASYHSGTDAARVCPSHLPASLPVKINQSNLPHSNTAPQNTSATSISSGVVTLILR